MNELNSLDGSAREPDALTADEFTAQNEALHALIDDALNTEDDDQLELFEERLAGLSQENPSAARTLAVSNENEARQFIEGLDKQERQSRLMAAEAIIHARRA